MGSIGLLGFGKFLVFVRRSRLSEEVRDMETEEWDLGDEREAEICH